MLPRPIDKLIILGLGRTVHDRISQVYATYEDLDWEVWTINAGGLLFRHDVLWDMHTDAYVETLKPETRALVHRRREALKAYDRPIMMPKAHPDLPTSVTFPLREVVECTGSTFFANGLSYLLAMALCCHVKRLQMYGCDLAYRDDHHPKQGLACCEYWIGRLVGAGCHVGSSPNGHFANGWRRGSGAIYGYDEPVRFEYSIGGDKPKFVGPDYADQ